MLGKLSIIGAVVAVSPQRCPPKWVAPLIPASTSGALLTPALPFAAPSSEVSLARIWGLGARRVGKFTVVASIVRPPQSSADDGADRHGQTSVLVGYLILDLAPCAALIGVSHACTPKLERRTRCRYSPRNLRATGPCCQSKPGHVGQ